MDRSLREAGRLADGVAMTPELYDAGREQRLVSEARKRSGPKLLADRLPTSGQILGRFDRNCSWTV